MSRDIDVPFSLSVHDLQGGHTYPQGVRQGAEFAPVAVKREPAPHGHAAAPPRQRAGNEAPPTWPCWRGCINCADGVAATRRRINVTAAWNDSGPHRGAICRGHIPHRQSHRDSTPTARGEHWQTDGAARIFAGACELHHTGGVGSLPRCITAVARRFAEAVAGPGSGQRACCDRPPRKRLKSNQR